MIVFVGYIVLTHYTLGGSRVLGSRARSRKGSDCRRRGLHHLPHDRHQASQQRRADEAPRLLPPFTHDVVFVRACRYLDVVAFQERRELVHINVDGPGHVGLRRDHGRQRRRDGERAEARLRHGRFDVAPGLSRGVARRHTLRSEHRGAADCVRPQRLLRISGRRERFEERPVVQNTREEGKPS